MSKKHQVVETAAVHQKDAWKQWSVIKQLEKAAGYPYKKEEYVLVQLEDNSWYIFREPCGMYPGTKQEIRMVATHPEIVEKWKSLNEESLETPQV